MYNIYIYIYIYVYIAQSPLGDPLFWVSALFGQVVQRGSATSNGVQAPQAWSLRRPCRPQSALDAVCLGCISRGHLQALPLAGPLPPAGFLPQAGFRPLAGSASSPRLLSALWYQSGHAPAVTYALFKLLLGSWQLCQVRLY